MATGFVLQIDGVDYPISREIDWVDAWCAQLIFEGGTGTSTGTPNWSAGDLLAWANANGANWWRSWVSTVLQEHKRAQQSSQPPQFVITNVKRGPYGEWRVTGVDDVPWIAHSTVQRAADDAITRILQCLEPSAAADPRTRELAAAYAEMIGTNLQSLAKLVGVVVH